MLPCQVSSDAPEGTPVTHALLRPVRIITAVVAAFVLTACSAAQTLTEDTVTEDTTDNTSEKKDSKAGEAKLLKAGFGRDGDYGFVSSLVKNTSADLVGTFVTVQFNLLDAGGELVASESQVEQFTSADQTLAIGTQLERSGKAKVSKVEATLELGTADNFAEDQPNFPVGKVKVGEDEYEGTQATFEVRNPTDASSSARVGIVCFNKAGKIIGGNSEFPDVIPAKGRVLVESSVLTSGKPDKCEAYAAPSDF